MFKIVYFGLYQHDCLIPSCFFSVGLFCFGLLISGVAVFVVVGLLMSGVAAFFVAGFLVCGVAAFVVASVGSVVSKKRCKRK